MIETTVNSISHSGGGTSFSIPFRFDRPDWLVVTLTNTLTDTVCLLTLGAGGDYQLVTDDDGTRLVLQEPIPANHVLDIRRVTPPLQEFHLAPNKPIFSTDLETVLDRLAMALQDRDPTSVTEYTNTLLFPLDEPVGFKTQLPSAIDRRGKIMGFKSSNGELELQTINSLADTVAQDAVDTIQLAAEMARSSATTAINTAYHHLFDDEEAFFYRHTNDGLVMGKVNDSEALVPGRDSLTIQSTRSLTTNIATGKEAIAIGKNSKATAYGSIATGLDSKVTGHGSIAFGYKTLAADFGSSVAFGYGSETHSPGSVSLGYFALNPANTSQHGSNVSLGSSTIADGLGVVAIGNSSHAANWYSVAVGKGCAATAYGCTAGGVDSVALTSMSCAYGYQSRADGGSGGGYSTAAGYKNIATGNSATAIGTGNISPGDNSTSVGNRNNMGGGSAPDSTAVGTGNTALNEGATAIGYVNIASGKGATAIGWTCQALNDSATAVGQQAKAAGIASTAVGYGATTNTNYSTEIRAVDSSTAPSNGSRIRLTGTTRGVALSYIQNTAAPGQTAVEWGTEANNYVVPKNMLTFRLNPTTGKLCIDVSVPTNAGATTFAVRTATLTLA